jgi:adenylate cyclase class 2
MQIEYEATFYPINKEKIRRKLKENSADRIYPEVKMKRVVFDVPEHIDVPGKYVRVRDEGDKVTLTLKQVQNNKGIEDQKEIELVVDDFEKMVEFLGEVGCIQKAFQETKREKWVIDEVEVTIDTWPFLQPFIEIEADSEEKVKSVTTKLGFDYSQAYFGSIDGLYVREYGIEKKVINQNTPRLTFEMDNPF